MAIFKVNDHTSVDIFEITTRTRATSLPTYWEQRLIDVLRNCGAFTQPIYSIGFVPNKRGFCVKPRNSDVLYFVRILFPSNIPLPYISRRILGQPDCCARAHVFNDGLAPRNNVAQSAAAIKYGILYSENILPCEKCFSKYSATQYQAIVKNNCHKDFIDSSPREYTKYLNHVLIWLTANNNISNLVDIDDTDLFDRYRIANIVSINRYFREIASYCRDVIDNTVVDPNKIAEVCAVTELNTIINTCLNICGDINDKPFESISIDDCYAYSEYMSRYRQNAQNIAFALRYSGADAKIVYINDVN